MPFRTPRSFKRRSGVVTPNSAFHEEAVERLQRRDSVADSAGLSTALPQPRPEIFLFQCHRIPHLITDVLQDPEIKPSRIRL
jgi:hypothetical protein